uniref:EGF-like domain-containing protein n=1 Tax=Strongyloides papillosus TaxID=174720 RepID=A0A0N5C504_STREA
MSISLKLYVSLYPSYYGNMFGYKDTYSFNDLKILNARYCQSTCSFNCLSCLNDGYQSPIDCGVCTCPPGYNGRLCENVDESDASCPRYSYLAERKKKTITICGGRDCLFLLEAPRGYKIVIEIDYALSRREFPCYRSDGIEIKYNKDKGKGGLCLCGYYENITLPARSNQVLVSFKGKKNAIAMSFSYYTIFDEKHCLL